MTDSAPRRAVSEPFRPRQVWAETMRTPAQVPDVEAMTPEAALEVWRDHGPCDSIGAEGWDQATEVIDGELERLRQIERRARVVAEIAMPMHGIPDQFDVQERTALHILGEA